MEHKPESAGETEEFKKLRTTIDDAMGVLESLEELIGVPKGTIRPLLEEPSDWSFIVKLAVLLEAALAEALVAHMGNEKLRKHVSSLQMLGRSGRIPLAASLDILKPEDAECMSAIAEVRNSFAHSVKNIGRGSLDLYFEQLSLHDQQLAYRRLMRVDDARAKDNLKNGWPPETARIMLWLGATKSLGNLYVRHVFASGSRIQRELADAQSKLVEAIEAMHGVSLRDIYNASPEFLKQLRGEA